MDTTPLYLAVRARDHEQVKQWIAIGADPRQRLRNGMTLLHTAVSYGDAAMVRLLLRYGVDPNVADESGRTPLAYAVVHDAARVRALLEGGADPNNYSLSGWTPLMSAARNGRTENVRLLLAAGAAVHPRARHSSWKGKTVLGLVSQGGYRSSSGRVVSSLLLDVQKLLLAHGADPNSRDDAGRTPLMDAAAAGRREIVALYLDAGGNPFLRDPHGYTARGLAIAGGHGETAALLEAHERRNTAGRRPAAAHDRGRSDHDRNR